MKRSRYSAPEPFALSPLLAILPSRGKVAKLEGLTSSLYARYEKVVALRKELSQDDARGTSKRFVAEEEMLKQVLDWLGVTPE